MSIHRLSTVKFIKNISFIMSYISFRVSKWEIWDSQWKNQEHLQCCKCEFGRCFWVVKHVSKKRDFINIILNLCGILLCDHMLIFLTLSINMSEKVFMWKIISGNIEAFNYNKSHFVLGWELRKCLRRCSSDMNLRLFTFFPSFCQFISE